MASPPYQLSHDPVPGQIPESCPSIPFKSSKPLDTIKTKTLVAHPAQRTGPPAAQSRPHAIAKQLPKTATRQSRAAAQPPRQSNLRRRFRCHPLNTKNVHRKTIIGEPKSGNVFTFHANDLPHDTS
jgi:hypothetical protein